MSGGADLALFIQTSSWSQQFLGLSSQFVIGEADLNQCFVSIVPIWIFPLMELPRAFKHPRKSLVVNYLS